MIFVAVVNALFGLLVLVLWTVLVVCYYTLVAIVLLAVALGALALWTCRKIKSLFTKSTSSLL